MSWGGRDLRVFGSVVMHDPVKWFRRGMFPQPHWMVTVISLLLFYFTVVGKVFQVIVHEVDVCRERISVIPSRRKIFARVHEC